MDHDRIHAREPDHHIDRWSTGIVESVDSRDGHCVFTVDTGDRRVELTVTFAVRDLVLDRLETDEEPVGERVWYRKRGG